MSQVSQELIISELRRYPLESIDCLDYDTTQQWKAKGITPLLLFTSPTEELVQRFELPPEEVLLCQSQIQKRLAPSFFVTASELLNLKRNQNCFTTGSVPLDDLLLVSELDKYGIILGETYEFTGGFRSGKTQLCHQLCTTVQLPPEMGGIGKKAIYIDTERTFSPSRIMAMADHLIEQYRLGREVDEFLANILVSTVTTSQLQVTIVQQLFDILSSGQFGLVIIDSGTSLFRAEYIGTERLQQRQQLMNRFLSLLSRIAYTFNVAIILTNQIVSSPDLFVGGGDKPVGGNIMAHWANHRLYLRTTRANQRAIKIIDSPIYPELDTIFKITHEGVL